MAVYVYIDVSQKQEYIYKNSKLIDNLYNSFIIKSITENLHENNMSSESGNIISLCNYLEKEFNNKYRFIYSGGGNSIIRFEDLENATKFVKGYSFEILKNYPDLELYISLVDEKEVQVYENNKDMLIRELLIQRSDELKDKRKSKFKRWTYGIEKIEENGRAIEIVSENQMRQRKQKKSSEERLVRKYLFNKFEDKLNDTAIITKELYKYKKDENGKSYIGVISIDGNKMGEMVKKITNFEELRKFSRAIDEIYFSAIVKALKEYKEKINATSLLLTPVLQAGDDICLIVEAEHAIEITANIIKKIEQISQDSNNKSDWNKFIEADYLTACGGVAIVRYTYPFFESIKIAEKLCHRAKEVTYLVETRSGQRQRNSFIDWEIVQSHVNTGIEYETYIKHNNLKENYHIKPLCIDQNEPVEDNIFRYDDFYNMIRKIQSEKEINISTSFLEELKKQIYNGINQYKLFLDMNKKEKGSLGGLIMAIFGDGKSEKNVCYEYMLYCDKSTYTYILNDVLETLPFMINLEAN
ncbi:hypothetical protein GOQ29_01835 [Clostridium sp. D2Q-14]|uniref:Cas10/Cmr2 second palm domain-containing protein n=1 Tax=Anaeromonas gelatinilytica TaxID=2683194 RepID=UPI00193BF652|nr:hypothetical protein [Anaeromonas gelatinilytica]MBS4534354.1 hypothetical protein [Anaeromonas gelatinilytica]